MLRPIVPQSILVRLLHCANANPSGCRDTFYVLKSRLLRQYAEFKGHDIQEITKECWGGFDYMGDPRGCKGEDCRRCGGTGIYDRIWFRLERWQWGKYVFHIPDGRTPLKPDSVQIHGRIQHADYGKASREAELWLFLATLQFGMWWKVLSTSTYLNPGWWPMCRLQCWAFWSRMKFNRRRCVRSKLWQPTILEDDHDVPF